MFHFTLLVGPYAVLRVFAGSRTHIGGVAFGFMTGLTFGGWGRLGDIAFSTARTHSSSGIPLDSDNSLAKA
uniref:hypothetical protein n=1 Tax=Rhodococcus erythropolis TaxID=1833 RepID=UPI00117B1126|nr:hypothetical protein [Rhodococcus erythropolis]